MHQTSSFPSSVARTSRAARLEICPPARARAASSWLQRLRDWYQAGWQFARTGGEDTSEPTHRLGRAREEFLDSIDDLTAATSDELRDRIHFARSLRELWHLRAEVFSLVSLCHSQREADSRLAALNRHFPQRDPRTGFGALTR
jgi:hypothetical protein